MSSFPKKNASRSSELPVVGSPWTKMFSFSSIRSHCKFVFVISASLIGTSTYTHIYIWYLGSHLRGHWVRCQWKELIRVVRSPLGPSRVRGIVRYFVPSPIITDCASLWYAAPVVKICSCLGLFLEVYPFKSIMVKDFNCTLVKKRFRQPEFSYLQATWTVALGLSAELWALSSYSKGPKWKC